jgi:TonB family protein
LAIEIIKYGILAVLLTIKFELKNSITMNLKHMKYFIIPLILSLISFNCFSQELSTKEANGKVGFFIGEKQILDFNYDEAVKEYKNFYRIRQGEKWGLVSPRGEEIIPCKYDALVQTWGNGYIVSLDDKYGVIDTLGRITIKIDYEDIDHVKINRSLVKKNKKWAILKKDGTLDFNKKNIVFLIPDRLPLFKFCKEKEGNYTELKRCADLKLLEYIYKNISYPNEARLNETQGMAVVSFIVTTKGALRDIKILRDPGDGCGESAKRVVESMKGRWTPAMQDGKKVPCQYNLPIRFKLND